MKTLPIPTPANTVGCRDSQGNEDTGQVSPSLHSRYPGDVIVSDQLLATLIRYNAIHVELLKTQPILMDAISGVFCELYYSVYASEWG